RLRGKLANESFSGSPQRRGPMPAVSSTDHTPIAPRAPGAPPGARSGAPCRPAPPVSPPATLRTVPPPDAFAPTAPFWGRFVGPGEAFGRAFPGRFRFRLWPVFSRVRRRASERNSLAERRIRPAQGLRTDSAQETRGNVSNNPPGRGRPGPACPPEQ